MSEDQKLLDDINAAPIGDRLKLIYAMIRQSMDKWDYMEPFEVTIVEHPEEFEIAMSLLKNMSENDGKVKWGDKPQSSDGTVYCPNCSKLLVTYSINVLPSTFFSVKCTKCGYEWKSHEHQ